MTEPIVLAGAGLLRWDKILSVNPVQKLRKLEIIDKIIIPNPVEQSDACTKAYADSIKLNIYPGDGITITDGNTIGIQENPRFESIRINGPINHERQAVSKRYVDNLISALPTMNYVNELVKSFVKFDYFTSSLEPLASRRYVESKLIDIVTSDQLSKSLEPLASKSYVDTSIVNLASISFVNSSIHPFATREEVSNLLNPLATKSYVDGSIIGFATTMYVDNKIELFATKTDVTTQISAATTPLVSKSYVDTAIQNFVNKSYMDGVVNNLATKVFVESLVSPLAEEAFVETAIEPLASKTYVDSVVQKSIKSALGTFALGMQHVTITSENIGETVVSSGKSFLILGSDLVLGDVSVKLSSGANGQILNIITLTDIGKLILLGNVFNYKSAPLSKGSSLKLVYCADDVTWLTY